ncbi:MAG TPA: carbonic anhydrase [Methanocorpusculum sp.]|nr:carbonic anhydrase [Methanocorpusculum sp.]
MIDELLEGNKAFIKEDFAKTPGHYEALSKSQHPTTLWIGCSDSRVDPERITNAKAGQIFVHRNIGNIVPAHDCCFSTIIEYAIKHLKVSDIVICGHSNCGALNALDAEGGNDAFIPLWVNGAREAKTRVDAKLGACSTPEAKARRMREIEFENIRLQLEHLRGYPLVAAAEAKGCIKVHGLFYNLETGELSKIA